MQGQTTDAARNETQVAPHGRYKQRSRNEFWYLVHRAERRRKRANAMFGAATVVVIAVFAFFYVVLTR